jgi:hypothetical protein
MEIPMSTVAERTEQELNAILAQYAAGEAEVVREFFSREHTLEQYADMLRRQMGREIFCVNWLDRMARMGEELERSVERHRYVDLLEQIAEEVKHYTVLADVAEWVLGRKLTAEEAREYEVYAAPDPTIAREQHYNPRLPEANAMLDLRWRLRIDNRTEFSDEVMRLSEGGGGGAFLEASQLRGDEFRERLAAAMKIIVKDELDHGPGRVPGFVSTYVMTEADREAACQLLRQIMAQHLRVRNEIYGHPLSPERLAAIDRGEIEPLRIHREPATATA